MDSYCDDSFYLTVAIVSDVAYAASPSSTNSSYGTVSDSGSTTVVVIV